MKKYEVVVSKCLEGENVLCCVGGFDLFMNALLFKKAYNEEYKANAEIIERSQENRKKCVKTFDVILHSRKKKPIVLFHNVNVTDVITAKYNLIGGAYVSVNKESYDLKENEFISFAEVGFYD